MHLLTFIAQFMACAEGFSNNYTVHTPSNTCLQQEEAKQAASTNVFLMF